MKNKIRVAVFGINDVILQFIRKEIDPRKIEIVLFLDNDKAKSRIHYMDIPVFSPTNEIFEKYKVDYVLITALSAYESIKDQLLKIGISKDQIQVFMTDDLCNYRLGNLEDIDTDFIYSAYFNPLKKIQQVIKYQEIYKEYMQISVCNSESEGWFDKSSLISHACGGVVNGRKIMYSNSKEAFYYSMDNNFRLIECDVMWVGKGELILAHDYERFYESTEEKYTMLSVREFFKIIKLYPDVNCLIDVKWDNHNEYEACIDEIEKIIGDISEDVDEYITLKKQIVMEVYDEATIQLAKEKDFDVIFTQYRNIDRKCFMKTVNLCYKYGIRAVALPLYGERAWQWKVVNIFTDKNIKIFVFSTDSVKEYKRLRKIGISGIFTNYLTEKEVSAEEGML